MTVGMKLTRMEAAVAALNEQAEKAILAVQLQHAEADGVAAMTFEHEMLAMAPEDKFKVQVGELGVTVDSCLVVKLDSWGVQMHTSRNAPDAVGVVTRNGFGGTTHVGVKLVTSEFLESWPAEHLNSGRSLGSCFQCLDEAHPCPCNAGGVLVVGGDTGLGCRTRIS
jgi:hypothetical protein